MIGDQFDEVIVAARSGQEEAFAVLYRDLNPQVVRYLGAQARSGAEDLASETWLAVAASLRTFQGDEQAFRAWLFTIARRRLIQHWRDTSRRPLTRPAGDGLDPADPTDLEGTVIAAEGAREAARTIAAVLTPDQADAVLLRVVAGLDVAQVAQILRKRPGAVRVLSHRALRRLAEHFPAETVTP